ncbi:antibiotic biosynthesis monooxygenase family protein [Kitasatospora camelliae]|uniref:Antibiotic biosynthesis monooxygenase n=1 Tax=Kitasatospora camelliae TaxID=3156397 RepID=A0AAU8K4L1_9ACTN
MIVRIWEAHVAPRRAEEFCAYLAASVQKEFADCEGFLGVEMLGAVSEEDHRVLLITRWVDEDALRRYAGPMWRIRPVWAEGELNYLEHPPTVAHYRPLLDHAQPGRAKAN